MTRDEWDDAMLRWMHRRDIGGDLDTVWETSSNLFFNSWLNAEGRNLFTNDDELLAAAPGPMLHAGLAYLHELAQDDNGAQREQGLFNSTMETFALNWSIVNVIAKMNIATNEDAA